MARRVFFSFHYENDIWRANQVRNSWLTKDREAAGFWDGSLWEEAKKKGEDAIKRMIDRGMEGTSVTAVLIGSETNGRKYIKYEIDRSLERGSGLLGIYIHRLGDQGGFADSKGENPFSNLVIREGGKETLLSQLFSTYDWEADDGYENFGDWVEKAARDAGR